MPSFRVCGAGRPRGRAARRAGDAEGRPRRCRERRRAGAGCDPAPGVYHTN